MLFLRLWALQVLSGDEYLNAAQNNQLRDVPGAGAARARSSTATAACSSRTSPAARRRSGPPTSRSKAATRCCSAARDACSTSPSARWSGQIRERRGRPADAGRRSSAASTTTRSRYLEEHQAEFPGVQIAETYLRNYPYQALGAHVLGHVGEITPEQLDADAEDGYRAGDRSARRGRGARTTTTCAAAPGSAQLRVDSLGRPRGRPSADDEPQPGHALRLTIDVELQRAAERALAVRDRPRARERGSGTANGGAIVALDPRDGEILALASYPTFEPSVYVGRVDPKQARAAARPRGRRGENTPALNRATTGLYPPGSTFKPVTALAAMQEHLVSAVHAARRARRDFDGLQAGVQELGPVRERPMDVPHRARDVVRHVLLRGRRRFYELPPRPRPPAAAVGVALRLRRARPGSTSGPRRPG